MTAWLRAMEFWPVRLAGLATGLALLCWVWRTCIRRRSRLALLPVVGVTAAGLLLLAGGLAPDIWRWPAATSYLTRIRLLMASVSALVLLVTCESIRHALLRERYALLWLGTGLLILLCAVETETLGWVSRTFGMQYVTTVVAVVFTFLILVAFHFSVALSRAERKLNRIVQRCAELEARLAALEAAARRPAE